MCVSMVDIQSATAEIRRGKKIEERKRINDRANIMSASATQGGHNEISRHFDLSASAGDWML